MWFSNIMFVFVIENISNVQSNGFLLYYNEETVVLEMLVIKKNTLQ